MAREASMSAVKAVPRDASGQAEILDAGVVEDPIESARAAGLRYVTDKKPGIQRRRAGDDFIYIGVDGQPVTDQKTLDRVKSIGIPPAWTEVWIAPIERGHIQATGRDAKGRKQYRYHPKWRAVRDETKFTRMVEFGETLPMIRKFIGQDLGRHGLPREKILATVVTLLDETHIRIGNEEYARENESYGLTTMQHEHVGVAGAKIHFEFRGKSGKDHVVDVKDRRVAKIVKQCEELPGHELFQYLDHDGHRHVIESDDVNQYLHGITGQHFTAKDFRTWAGTVTAAHTLKELGPFDSEAHGKHNVVEAVKRAAAELGNTPAICRKSYVHPGVIDAYLHRTLLPSPELQQEREAAESREGMHPVEAEVLALVRGLMSEDEQGKGRGAA
jgi:DNA topoisomerase-1